MIAKLLQDEKAALKNWMDVRDLEAELKSCDARGGYNWNQWHLKWQLEPKLSKCWDDVMQIRKKIEARQHAIEIEARLDEARQDEAAKQKHLEAVQSCSSWTYGAATKHLCQAKLRQVEEMKEGEVSSLIPMPPTVPPPMKRYRKKVKVLCANGRYRMKNDPPLSRVLCKLMSVHIDHNKKIQAEMKKANEKKQSDELDALQIRVRSLLYPLSSASRLGSMKTLE